MCDVVAVQAQVSQMGEAHGCDVLAETRQVDLCRDLQKTGQRSEVKES